MGEESNEMHSEDDKALVEKNKKRTVKTRAQVEALEKFYNEHKYPSESMKMQVAESIGLTEKQVSGWFCHRRLKDKKLINGENCATGRPDRSSGVIQDRGSGHKQDSCGSTKQGDDRNCETREVESGRLTAKEFSAADLTYERGSHYAGNYNRTDDASSGSSSSLRNMSNNQNGAPLDAAISRHLIPKFPSEGKGVKPRPGPSGYLKVKGQVENASITAVKRQLGKNYREDGPPLGIEFDPLPPGAFESSMEDPVEENYCTGEALPATSSDASKIRPNPKFGKGCDYKASMASNNCDIDGRSLKMRRGSDIPDGYTDQKYRMKTSLPYSGAYYPRRNSSVELPEDLIGSEGRDEYEIRPKVGVEVMRMDSVSGHPNPQPFGGKVREERAESWPRKYNNVSTKLPLEENTEDEFSNLARSGNEYHKSGDRGVSRLIIKDGKMHHDRRMISENRAKIPLKNDFTSPKRIREEFPRPQHLKAPQVVNNLPQTFHQVIRPAREMPSSFSEDEESAETSSSVD